MRAEKVAMTGSVVSGTLASACCIGPLVFPKRIAESVSKTGFQASVKDATKQE